jgi:ABC-type uncharacterized transport system substrate-binding protein
MRWGVGGALASAILVAAAAGQAPAPKRILHLDSYHHGYSVSDETEAGIRSVLVNRPVELSTFYLDTKRRGSEAQIAASVEKALAFIASFKPDVLIASDDAAVKYVIVPHFKDGPVPVVFCGVNWSAEAYGLPNANVTGMVEVFPILEGLELARKHYPSLRRLGVLSEDSLSEERNREFLEPRYRSLGFEVSYVMVKEYAAWKREFVRLQEAVDVLYLPTQAAIHGWDPDDARALVRSTLTKPVVATDEFMMPYAVFGLVKIQAEQGEWAAAAALKILAGKRPSEIPGDRNRRRKLYLNPTLARRAGFVPGAEFVNVKTIE